MKRWPETIPTTQLAPSERTLRQHALESLAYLPVKNREKITQLFAQTGTTRYSFEIWDAIVMAITTAKRGTRWAGGDAADPISIGYYANASAYFTGIFHETGHKALRYLGITTAAFSRDPVQEEYFCWRFSRTACAILKLPYSINEEKLNKQFCSVIQQLADPNNIRAQKKFQKLIKKERKLTGYSEWDTTTES